MQLDCNRTSYFDTSEFESLFLHYFGCIAIPIHLVGAICILYQTPRTMQSMKWSLLNLHFWSCFLDLGLTFLSTPYILVPAPVGWPLGVLSYLGVGVAEQTYLWLTMVGVVTVSTIRLFERRYHILTPDFPHWPAILRTLYFINCLVTIGCFLPAYLQVPEQESAKAFLVSLAPCIPDYVDLKLVFVFTTNTRVFLRPGTASFAFFFGQIFFFAIMSNRVLNRQMLRRTVSEKTVELQKKFQKVLVLQVSIPVTIIAIPLSYMALSSLFWYHNQTLNNICLILIGSHGFISTIVMVYIHQPYRQFISSFFAFGIRFQTTNAISMQHLATSQMT